MMLSSIHKGIVKPENQSIVPVKDVRSSDLNAYFTKVLQLMKDNQPTAADASLMNRMNKIVLVPGQEAQLSQRGVDKLF